MKHRWMTLERLGLLAGFLLLLGFQLFLVDGRLHPVTYCDELGYLANAAALTGRDWSGSLHGQPYYPFGSSLFMLPFFLLQEDMPSIYQSIVRLYAVLGSLVFLFAYQLGKRWSEGESRLSIGLAAFVVALYPTHLLYSAMLWSENVLVFLYLLSVGLSSRLVEKGTSGRLYASFGALIGLLYAVHHRNVALLLTATACTGLLLRRGVCSRRAFLCYLGALALFLGAGRAMDSYLVGQVWQDAAEPVAQSADLWALATGRGLAALLATAAGQSFYLGAATYLLLFFGLDHGRRLAAAPSPDGFAARYALLSFVAAFGVSVVKSTIMETKDGLLGNTFHGRYLESFLAPVLLLGLLSLLRGREQLRTILFSAAAFLYSGFTVFHLAHDRLQNSLGYFGAVTGIFPHLTEQWRVDVLATVVTVLCVAGVLMALFRKRPMLGLCGLAAVFLHSTAVNYKAQIANAARWWQDEGSVTGWIRSHQDSPVVYFLTSASFDARYPKKQLCCHYQFALPERRIQVITDVKALDPGTSPYLIVAGLPLPAELSEARLVAVDQAMGSFLWVVSQAEQQRLQEKGVRFLDPGRYSALEGGATLLVPDAYRSRLSSLTPGALQVSSGLLTRLRGWLGHPSALRLRVEHAGSDTIWPTTVRVGVLWMDPSRPGQRLGEQRVELPRRLGPGEALEIEVPLLAVDSKNQPLAPGPYEVQIGLVHENVTWFYQKGDEMLKLSVSVAEP